jgi:hypothetical protein
MQGTSRMRIAVLAALLVVLVVVASAQSATHALTPHTLYQTLLTSKFAPVPDGFYDPTVGTDDLDKRDKKHHAVGRVLVTFSGGDAGSDYGIFPTLKDANDRWREPPQAPSGSKINVVGKVPGFNIPTEWINGSITGKNAFGQKVTNGLTSMCALSRVVMLCVVTTSVDNNSSGDVPAAITLLKASLKHLDAVRARLR